MKILLWSQNDLASLGGVEVFLRILATGLLERGHRIELIAGHTNAAQPSHGMLDGLPVHRFPFFEALSSRSVGKIDAIVRGVRQVKQAFDADVVHVNFTDAGPFFHLRTSGAAATVLSLWDVLSLAPSSWPLARSLAERADRVVTPSNFLAEDLCATLSLPRQRFQVIECGVGDIPSSVASGPKIGGDFVTLSRLVPEKGVQSAIDAIAYLSKHGIAANLRIVGAGPYRPELVQRVEQQGIASRVQFVGRVAHDRLGETLESALAVLVPSTFPETFGISAADAALAGLPVIASRIGALPEVVLHEETGLLFPPGDFVALAEAMRRLIRDESLAQRLGKAARERARVLYSRDRMIDAFEALYRSVC
jgi:glycogen(starch) synthase